MNEGQTAGKHAASSREVMSISSVPLHAEQARPQESLPRCTAFRKRSHPRTKEKRGEQSRKCWCWHPVCVQMYTVNSHGPIPTKYHYVHVMGLIPFPSVCMCTHLHARGPMAILSHTEPLNTDREQHLFQIVRESLRVSAVCLGVNKKAGMIWRGHQCTCTCCRTVQ